MSVDPQHIKAGAPGAPEARAYCCLCQRMFRIDGARSASATDLARLAEEHACDAAEPPVWAET